MDTKVFQLALKGLEALDAGQFDRSFVTREEALDDVSCLAERQMAPSQDLRRRHSHSERANLSGRGKLPQRAPEVRVASGRGASKKS
jgi:hypothetical protein